MARIPVVLAGALLLSLAVGAPARAAVLHDQLAPSATGNVNSQNFEPSLNAYDDLGADDVVVPANQVWRLQRVEVSADGSGTTEAATANVFVFGTAGALPGEVLFSQLDTPRDAGPIYPDLTLALAGAPILGAGRYWIGVQANLNFSPGSNNWWWRDRAPQFGLPAAWRQPGNGFGDGCTAFVGRAACPSYPSSGATPDQAFRLSGVAAGSRLKAKRAKAKRRGRVRLKVNVPAPGTLIARGKGLKTSRAQVEEIGIRSLLVKPKGATLAGLAAGRAVRAKLRLTLKRPGQKPLKAKTRLRLRR